MTSGEHGYDDRDPYDRDDELVPPERNMIVKRSFDGIATLGQNAATQALIAQATAEINARWMIAQHRPRDVHASRQALQDECKRPGFASKAIYEVPRAGSKVTGMTIRFAESAAAHWGNIGMEAKTLYDDDDQRLVRVTVTDYQTSVTWSRDITVPKTKETKELRNGQRAISERVNSSGQVVYRVEATDDDVRTKEASEISKASRTGILRVIPAWLIAECRAMCEATQRNKAAEDPEAYRKRTADAYAALGIKVQWIADYLEKPLEQATPDELAGLERLFRALKDKEITASEAMAQRKASGDGKPAGVAASAVRRARKGDAPIDKAEEREILASEAREHKA